MAGSARGDSIDCSTPQAVPSIARQDNAISSRAWPCPRPNLAAFPTAHRTDECPALCAHVADCRCTQEARFKPSPPVLPHTCRGNMSLLMKIGRNWFAGTGSGAPRLAWEHPTAGPPACPSSRCSPAGWPALARRWPDNCPEPVSGRGRAALLRRDPVPGFQCSTSKVSSASTRWYLSSISSMVSAPVTTCASS